MDNAACLTARELRYSLGTRRLINDVSLSLASGEMVAIIGPNGAGKSTLLRLLTGYLTPDCGECRLLDRPLEHWAPQQLAKVRAVMRQYSDLAFSFSVEEVVSMGRAPHGKRDEHQAIQQVMEQTDCLRWRSAITAGCPVANSSGCSWRGCWRSCGNRNRLPPGCFSTSRPRRWICITSSTPCACCAR